LVRLNNKGATQVENYRLELPFVLVYNISLRGNKSMNFKEIQELVATEKMRAAAYFADQSVPLDKRWSAFVEAPDYVKDDRGSMCSELDKYFGDDVVRYDGVVHAERHSRHSTTNIVESLEEDYDELDEVDRGERVHISVIKERILADNFGFFEYDW
jgi:hypothetical protein